MWWDSLGGHSRSSVLEDGKCPCEAFLRGELLGIIDKLQFDASLESRRVVEGRRLYLVGWARRLLGLMKGSGEMMQLGRGRRGTIAESKENKAEIVD